MSDQLTSSMTESSGGVSFWDFCGSLPPVAWVQDAAQQQLLSSPASAFPPLPIAPGETETGNGTYDGSLIVASNDGYVRSLAIRTGAVQWLTPTAGLSQAPVMVEGLFVYVLTGGALCVYDLISGTLLYTWSGTFWTAGPASTLSAGWNAVILTGLNYKVQMLDTRYPLPLGIGRSTLWTWSFPWPYSDSEVTPLVYGKKVFVTSHIPGDTGAYEWRQTAVACLNLDPALPVASRAVWNITAPLGRMISKMVISSDGTMLYFTTRSFWNYDSRVYAMSALTGKVVWMYLMKGVFANAPALFEATSTASSNANGADALFIHGDTFLTTVEATFTITKLGKATGAFCWQYTAPSYWNQAVYDTSPLVVESAGLVLVPSTSGVLRAYRMQNDGPSYPVASFFNDWAGPTPITAALTPVGNGAVAVAFADYSVRVLGWPPDWTTGSVAGPCGTGGGDTSGARGAVVGGGALLLAGLVAIGVAWG